jgi:hypothetical protein
MPSTANLRRIPAPQAEQEVAESTTDPASIAPWLAVVAEKVKTIRYGVVQIVVHDSKIMQIERTERTRFEVPPAVHER